MKNLQNSLYQDRIVLITGTTKGIGLHLAKHFLEQERNRGQLKKNS